MRFRDHYDWVVLGSHPGALLSASIVAKLGLSVLVLPMGIQTGRRVIEGERFLDPDPNYSLGLGGSGKVDGLILHCLKHVGMTSEEAKSIEFQKCSPQILTPMTRLSFSNNAQLKYEFQREFGEVTSQKIGLLSALEQTELQYLTFWQQLPAKFTLSLDRKKNAVFAAMTLSELKAQLIKSSKLSESLSQQWTSTQKNSFDLITEISRSDSSEIFEGLYYWLTSNIHQKPSLFDLLHLINLSKSGGSYRGGMTSYKHFLMSLAKRLGAHVPIKTECRRVFIEKGKFAGIQLSSLGSMISAEAGILGCQLKRLNSISTYTGRSIFKKDKISIHPVGWRFTVALTVRAESIPKGSGSRMVWKEENAPVIEIEVVNPVDYNSPTSDRRILYMRTVLPYAESSLDISFLKLNAARMLRQVIHIFPFLEFHIVHIFPDFRMKPKTSSAATEVDDFVDAYSFSSLDSIPDNLLVYEGSGTGSSTGIEGLFIASEESYPELGNFGGVFAAFEGISWIAHQSGFAGPFSSNLSRAW